MAVFTEYYKIGEAKALVNADKDLDVLNLLCQRHGYIGKQHLDVTKKRWNYVVEHVKVEEPIWDFKWE